MESTQVVVPQLNCSTGRTTMSITIFPQQRTPRGGDLSIRSPIVQQSLGPVPRRVSMYYMVKETMTVRIEPETRDALDAIAASLDRDRSFVVNEALAAYIDTHRWQVEHIQHGLREA